MARMDSNKSVTSLKAFEKKTVYPFYSVRVISFAKRLWCVSHMTDSKKAELSIHHVKAGSREEKKPSARALVRECVCVRFLDSRP